MRILITGFGPFGEVVNNPSGRLAEHFGAEGMEGHNVTGQVLPVSYRRADEEIRRLLTAAEYDLVLLMGVAVSDPDVRLEIAGRNRSSVRKKDADGDVTTGWVRHGGRSMLPATVSVRGMVRRLQAEGIRARVSRTAGDYVCNHAYYAALHTLRHVRSPARCLFVHVPCDEFTLRDPARAPTTPFEKLVKALGIIVSEAARASSSLKFP